MGFSVPGVGFFIEKWIGPACFKLAKKKSDVALLYAIQQAFNHCKVYENKRYNYQVSQKYGKVFFLYFHPYPPCGGKYFPYLWVRYLYFLVKMDFKIEQIRFLENISSRFLLTQPADYQGQKDIQHKLNLYLWIQNGMEAWNLWSRFIKKKPFYLKC